MTRRKLEGARNLVSLSFLSPAFPIFALLLPSKEGGRGRERARKYGPVIRESSENVCSTRKETSRGI